MSEVADTNKPWAYVATKNGQWAGVASAEMPKKDLGKFMAEFASDGFSITTVHSREQWLKLSSEMPMWRRPR